ncbi:transketolase [Patescibacteria group bacterium]|nr:transketolase [Patescibacteria group bacterium]
MDNKETAKKIRELILKTLYKSQTAHMGSNLSMADIVAVLYGTILNVDPQKPDWEDRDRFILSKGHAALAVYCALALKGFFLKDWLDTYYQNGGKLAGHMTAHGVPGVEASTGSLGHGFSIAVGMALAAQRDGKKHRVFTVLSDGEMDEGSTWEPLMFASHHKLDNLVAIVDYNKIQSLDRVENTLNIEPFAAKWRDFGWAAKEVDGHNVEELEKVLQQIPFEQGKPSCVIAHTIKGKGVSFMEDTVEWHYKNLGEEEFKQALREINQ